MKITYTDIRNHVVEYLKQHLGQSHITVATHPGKLHEDEIPQLSREVPSIIVSLMAVKKDGPEDRERLSLTCWLLIGSTSSDQLHDQALTLLSGILPLLLKIDAPWSIGGATDLQAENLYTIPGDDLKLSLWAVRWDWNVRSATADVITDGGIPGLEDLHDFERYNATHEVGTNQVDDSVDL